MAAAAVLVAPMDDKRKWVFKVVPNDDIMANAILKYIAKIRRQDARLYRRLRRLWRRLLQGAERGRAQARHHADRPRGLRPQRRQRYRTGAEDHRDQARRGVRRLGRHARGAAAKGAARARLQGADLPDPRRRHRGIHQARRQGCRRRDLHRRGLYGRQRSAGRQPVPQNHRELRRRLQGRQRQPSPRSSAPISGIR